MNSAAVVVDGVLPSPELAAALVEVHHTAEVSFEDRLAAVAGWERLIAWATAMQGEQLLALDVAADVARFGWHAADAARSLSEQIGLALGISGGSAARRLITAATLQDKVPAMQEALRAGVVGPVHARAVATAAAHVPDEVAQQAAVATLVEECWRTPVQLADTFARHVLTLDPEGAADRNRAARRERRITRGREADGMRSLWALLPAEAADAVYDQLDACARSSLATNAAGDERTLDARRVDALVQLVTGQISNGCPTDPGADPDPDRTRGAASPAAAASEPTMHGRRPAIQVTVSWSTLLGLDDAPAFLAGHGPIDADTARRIAADSTATWRRLLVDPASGQPLDHGRTTYRPPQDLQDFVQARDRSCRFPGCDRVAAACDLDHRTAWDAGGTTCDECLCRRHHLLKHQGGWTHTRDPDTGASTWTDPRGRTWHRPATVQPCPEPVEPPHLVYLEPLDPTPEPDESPPF